MPLKKLATVGAMALLSSCSPPDIDIAVEQVGTRMLLRFSQDRGFFNKRPPCLQQLAVHEPGTYSRAKAAWLIEAKGEVQCLDLAEVTVGAVPKGWQEVLPFAVSKGHTYTISVDGIGSGDINVRF